MKKNVSYDFGKKSKTLQTLLLWIRWSTLSIMFVEAAVYTNEFERFQR